MNIPNPDDRWLAWQLKVVQTDRSDMNWARRGDGALMLQDEYGWFVMVTDPEGGIITAATDTDPTQFQVYCEPIWLAWAADAEYERDHADS